MSNILLTNLTEVANNIEQINRVDVDALQDTVNVESMWLQELSKTNEHFLLSREWLNDSIVNSSQRLIAISFPLCNSYKIPILEKL